ncbi:MAG: NADPH:quinone reductase-like Zn-dependent oxidoreductase [Bradymonadia bacterium]|jgi:NADPH:quinone reductase-like Zn-dependent oxidoreductase
MKVWEIPSFGLDNLSLVERPDPMAGPGQAVVRVTANAINYRDVMTVQGLYNPKQVLPLVPLSDAAGIVESVGEGVTRVKVGDRVATTFAQNWISGPADRDRLRGTLGGPGDGTLAERVCVYAEGLVHIPDYLTDEEAATLPCAAVTAWNAIAVQRSLSADETLLVLGTGGVSIFALQLAKLRGARVIITSSSDEKLERARALGADHTINYRTTPKWWKEVRRLTDDVGVQQVIEVGGAGTFDQSIRSCAIGAHVSLIGVLAGLGQSVDLVRVLMQNVRVQGIIVGNRDAFESMLRAMAAHEMRPVVDHSFAFGDAKAALAALGEGRHFGKIVIRGT